MLLKLFLSIFILGQPHAMYVLFHLGDSYTSFSTEEGQGHIQMRKRLYLPRVEDRNSNMRMLKISSYDNLVLSSMNILEPTLVDCNGNPHEDGMTF